MPGKGLAESESAFSKKKARKQPHSQTFYIISLLSYPYLFNKQAWLLTILGKNPTLLPNNYLSIYVCKYVFLSTFSTCSLNYLFIYVSVSVKMNGYQ